MLFPDVLAVKDFKMTPMFPQVELYHGVKTRFKMHMELTATEEIKGDDITVPLIYLKVRLSMHISGYIDQLSMNELKYSQVNIFIDDELITNIDPSHLR